MVLRVGMGNCKNIDPTHRRRTNSTLRTDGQTMNQNHPTRHPRETRNVKERRDVHKSFDRSIMSHYAPPAPLPIMYGIGSGIGSGAMNNAAPNTNVLASAAAAAAEKIQRELFVGNTPAGTSELLLLHFLNAAMRRVNLCGPTECPILNCRLNQKFAFIECATAALANAAMNMNGIPFLGAFLKISRPSKYHGPGPHSATGTWQDLTGQSLPTPTVLDADMEKMSRELFIGNTTPEMTEGILRDFLGNAMNQVGLTTQPGNPIQACRVSGKFAFVELRSAEEATAALNLNNIPYMGVALRVGRPSKWTGPPDNTGNWEDILAKYMAGQIPVAGDTTTTATTTAKNAATNTANGAGTPHNGAPPSRVVMLTNMLSVEDLANPEEYNDLLLDIREECQQFGTLQQVIIPRLGEPGYLRVFLEYAAEHDATKALQALEGRTFNGQQVIARYYDPKQFADKNYAAE